MSSIKEVAARAGVSISTVSNVLNKKKYVSPELEARVEKAVKELNYEVNPIAASMKSKKTGTIGVITEDMCGVFYPYIVKGISQVTEQKGYKMIICDVNGRQQGKSVLEREKELFYELVASRVDGIIFTSTLTAASKNQYFLDFKNKAEHSQKRIPIVSLERDLTMLGIDSVYFEGKHNAKKAVHHLLDCGCKKICHIAGPKELHVARERLEGYVECLKEHNQYFDQDKMIAYGDYSHQSGYVAMKQLLEQVPDLDGVFCGNDQMAIGALKVLKEYGKKIPEEVKLMGYDDVFVSNIVDPAISTIHIPKKTAGRKAAELLFERIEHPEDMTSVMGIKLESRLVVRKSTKEGVEEDWQLSDW